MPNINDYRTRLDQTARDMLGEEIEYKAEGAGAYAPLMADVDYGDATAEFNTASLVVQAISVSLLQADVPAKPGAACRVKLALLPGLIFSPVNVRNSEGGTDWVFGLEEQSS